MKKKESVNNTLKSVQGYVAFIALSTLFYELALIRILDVLWYPHFSYMVITLALLGFGIAGVMTSIFAHRLAWQPKVAIPLTSLLAISYIGVFVLLSVLQIDFNEFSSVTSLGLKVFLSFSGLLVPFFLSGFILSLLFTEYAGSFGRLYAWDLAGAALGCILVPLLIPSFGGPGLLFAVSGLTFAGAAILARTKTFRIAFVSIAILVILFPFVAKEHDYLEIPFHMDKRGIVKLTKEPPLLTVWDRIARIDLIKYTDKYTWIAYDGGTQTSYYYDFDGNYEKLRQELPKKTTSHFWDRFVYVSHWLKEGTDAKVLVIGAAGGQETKAAVTFGASAVDAVEMVGSVIRLGKEKYAIEPYNNPVVNAVQGEGRSFLRSGNKTYDIIQMMSNHTSASISSGSGAVSPNYLQTVDAYEEYFSHLSENGVLHINHHVYPKMVLTAAQAWKNMGRDDFSRHVLIYYSDAWCNLPTLLIKMKPWTLPEFNKVDMLMRDHFKLVHNPLNPTGSALKPEFFTGHLPAELEENIPYRMHVPTDNQPYFNHLRKRFAPVSFREPYVDRSLKVLLNDSIKNGIPMDVIHLIVTAGAALALAVLCLFAPLLFSKVGRAPWKGKTSFVTYFACLGAGFISIELIFIQLFHKLIGYPLYTYAAVVFAFLIAAGTGSYLTDKFSLDKTRIMRFLPFLGIPLYGTLLLLLEKPLLDFFLQWSTWIRLLGSVALIFPLGAFLGMPFAIGIAGSHTKGRGAVGWAWAVNGLFTVLGSVLSVLAATYFGFILTLSGAFLIYILAGLLLPGFAPFVTPEKNGVLS
ncbi:Spermidine synthase [Candidatus Electrothrix aarhusensis]|uniref:Spermidine synthase n=1 Tax=Candidatus Electrothrix aarhusensis TaxID=1859131 RepID=A0A3S3QR77_9BACT|nr:Spermidine synthase [Candidatus Electrothrix aarhusensis]